VSPETLEVFCPRNECGDSQVGAGGVVATKRRRMNYMGTANVGFAKRVFLGVLFRDRDDVRLPTVGLHYIYQCPVCGYEKSFVQRGDLLTEA
jgi:hypothetical protein